MQKFLTQRGYTLLFSVLTAALVLGVAVFIVDIARKQFILSTTARESMFAFYAADSGVECAARSMQNTGSQGMQTGTTSSVTLSCNGDTTSQASWVNTPVAWNSPSLPYSSSIYKDSFDNKIYYTVDPIRISFANNTCALIRMYSGYDSNGVHWTGADSLGYNLCSGSPLSFTVSPQTVERAEFYYSSP